MKPLTDPIYRPAPFDGRANFGTFLNSRHLTEVAVEIGVHQGFFAKQLLSQWQGRLFCGVDPWRDVIPGYDERQMQTLPDYKKGRGTFSHNPRAEDLRITQEELAPFEERVVLLQALSEQAARIIRDILDFVYIDGNHRPEFVLQDIQLWWPKVRSGGILAGHDIWFVRGGFCEGVEPIVRHFFGDRSLPIYLVSEPGRVWSWFVQKP